LSRRLPPRASPSTSPISCATTSTSMASAAGQKLHAPREASCRRSDFRCHNRSTPHIRPARTCPRVRYAANTLGRCGKVVVKQHAELGGQPCPPTPLRSRDIHLLTPHRTAPNWWHRARLWVSLREVTSFTSVPRAHYCWEARDERSAVTRCDRKGCLGRRPVVLSRSAESASLSGCVRHVFISLFCCSLLATHGHGGV